MRNFLIGIAIGVPVGMLVGDHRQAIARRIRNVVTRDFARVRSEGDRVAEALNRVAERAREAAGAVHERSMERSAEGSMLNQVAREELLGVYGIGPVLAQRILDGRPYRSDHEVVENGILNEQTFEQLKKQVLERHRKRA